MEINEMKKMFAETFGEGGELRVFTSPGRVNLIGEYVLKYDWVSTKTSLGTKDIDKHNVNAFATVTDFQPNAFARLKGFESTADAIVSEFVSKDGYAYMAVNYTEPTAGIVNNVNFDLGDVKSVMVVKEGVREDRQTENGKITVSLKSGEGVLVIPSK